ncbi:hypothetical protein OSB04_019052 [Centaurea solstitialis]|uniref:Uncharacterized protein n=1 Tax=Centaurea solstitialis TaxID=347529 RepID=A0AA38SPK0_9ASTR|nr:hypothetical protein OSB04_019052 [Centaurea solstitialis]
MSGFLSVDLDNVPSLDPNGSSETNLMKLVLLSAIRLDLLLREEGINYDETFAPAARLEAIRLFLAYAAHVNFKRSMEKLYRGSSKSNEVFKVKTAEPLGELTEALRMQPL